MKTLQLLAITLVLAGTSRAQIAPQIKPTPESNSTPPLAPSPPSAAPSSTVPPPAPPAPPVPPIAPIPPVAPTAAMSSKSNNDTTHFRIGRLKFTVVDDSTKKNKKGEFVNVSEDDDDDTASVRKHKERQERRSMRKLHHLPHWSGFEMGINGFTTPSGSLKMPKGYDFLDLRYSVSYTVNLNFWEKSINLYKNYVHIYTGMGVEWDNFKFSKQMSLVPGADSIKAVRNSNEYDVNKLTLVYLNVPLMLEINTSHNKNHTFHIAGGIIAGYMMDSYTKETFKRGNVDYKAYQEDDFAIDPFRFSAALRVGYGKLNLFATYGLNKMFNNGPDIHPFTVGLTLIGL